MSAKSATKSAAGPASKSGKDKTSLATKSAAAVKDPGAKPFSFDLETATKENANYRTVAWSGRYLQVTLMSIPVGGDIGLEKHPETDQFIRLDAGKGLCQMGKTKKNLSFEQEVEDGWCVTVPAGTWHNITNTGDEPMQVYVVYAPVHHSKGKIHKTQQDAMKDKNDKPPAYSVQPHPDAEDKEG